ncbi:MAG: hypothetical protein PWP70_1127 [Moorella sp. (in: firmicutes)]|nr:hypothetical protein [Moorella sp. (in: firmicutes)]
MSAMPEESLREIAATNEPPHTLASPEFFFLLQRIDRLDEKLTQEIRAGDHRSEERVNVVEQRIDMLAQRIDAVEQKLTQRIEKMDDKLNNLKFWAIGAVITIAVGFIGTIATLLYK